MIIIRDATVQLAHGLVCLMVCGPRYGFGMFIFKKSVRLYDSHLQHVALYLPIQYIVNHHSEVALSCSGGPTISGES